ncbi:MerR family DNA-binding transcriptional regulator [Thermodesulfobium fumaratoxidans]
MTISEVSEKFDISKDTLRYYQKRRKTPCFNYGDIRRLPLGKCCT